MSEKRGRKPIPNREVVRTTHVTIKVSPLERALIFTLVDLRRSERKAAGLDGVYTVSAFVRELVAREARRRRVAKPKADC